MHDATDKCELNTDIHSILPDVVPAGCGIATNKLAGIVVFGEYVGGVPHLRDLGDDSVWKLLSREFGICALFFFCEVAVDVAYDGLVWGFAG